MFSCDGHSIYIFEDEWNFQNDVVNGSSANIWSNTTDEDVKLWILKMEAHELPTVQSWIRRTFSEYALLEDNQGGLGGTNADGHMIDAQIMWADDIAFILINCTAWKMQKFMGCS